MNEEEKMGTNVNNERNKHRRVPRVQVPLSCMDCKMPYSKFPLDMLFPRGQWLAINPKDGGLLCANCMVKRASKLKGAVVVHAVVEIINKDTTKGN